MKFARRDLCPVFPFTALAGQDRMKLALLLPAVDPGLGGTLLIGQKGTAKSTAVRGLSRLLPAIETAAGCPFNCPPADPGRMCPDCRATWSDGDLRSGQSPTPFFTLPLGATEDRVAGGLDLEPSLTAGRPVLKPGLIGQANRGFLYVDEINLLDPYLAHLLLDAAESGRQEVQREGLSFRHPAEITLIGSMNPEEGPLGPQLADRFALTARVTAETDPVVRAEIVRRRLAFEADPAGFIQAWRPATEALADRIQTARSGLADVFLTHEAEAAISALSREHHVQGHRADLALARAARAWAAFHRRHRADREAVAAVAELALTGRTRTPGRRPIQVRAADAAEGPADSSPLEKPYISGQESPPPRNADAPDLENQPRVQRLYDPHESFDLTTPVNKREKGPRQRSGRRTARKTASHRGRYYRSSPQRLGRPVALDATLRAAAPHQIHRKPFGQPGLVIRRPDVREKVYRQKTGRLVLFVVDASGSVGSLERMSEAKAAALSLIGEAYQKRDRVGLIAFHQAEAEVLLPPTSSVETASRLLKDLPTGGKTPLTSALILAHNLLRVELARDPELTPLVVLMTDGRPNVPFDPAKDAWREALQTARLLVRDRRLQFLLVDTDRGHYADYKMTRELAQNLMAPRLTLEDLRAGALDAWLEGAA